ncbi:MAG: VCBS repeat-containing protein [bacterium]|jgi:hypothetical protein
MYKILGIGVIGLLLILPSTAISQSLFAPSVNYPGGPADGFGLTGADFDRDGDIDLASTRWLSSGAVGIVMNNGDGTFLLPEEHAIEMGGELVSADFDGDSDIDLVARGQGSGRIYVIKNNGNGSFLTPQSVYQGVGGPGIDAGDIDSDGDIDVVASSESAGAVVVLKNNGNATFATPIYLMPGKQSTDIFLGTLDSDSDLDLAILLSSDSTVSVWLNNGSGNFEHAADFPADGLVWTISGGDFDGDTDVDLAVLTNHIMQVKIFLNGGNGIFAPYNSYPISGTQGPSGISLADFDFDGDIDIAVGTSTYTGAFVDLLLNDGSGAFPVFDSYSIGQGIAMGIFSADLDGDADFDIALTGISYGIGVMLNVFTPPADIYPPAAASDFRIGDVQPNSVQLLWTAPGDNGVVGIAYGYDIRYATEPITDDNWALATQVTNEPQPQAAGSAESMVIDNLTSLVTYYFAIKSSDEVGNISGISNVVSATTAFRCGDSNRDGLFNILDVIYLIRTLYKNGPPPTCQ